MFPPISRIPTTPEERLRRLEKEHKEAIKSLLSMEPYVKVFLGNKLCQSTATDGFFYQSGRTLYLCLYNVDIPTVIEQVCGPVHREFNIDWKMRVEYDSVELSANLKTTTIGTLTFRIVVEEREMRTCKIVHVKVGERTQEEITKALEAALKRDKIEYRIDCNGEEY
jgi:hypothetical protein